MNEPRWPPEIVAPLQEAVRQTARTALDWVTTVVIPQIEEHTTDAEERWTMLKRALRGGKDG